MSRVINMVASIIAVSLFVVVVQVWATKAGAPQQVWLYCDTLGWCAPTHPPYCPPDPRECE
jgi:hypothetical protein